MFIDADEDDSGELDRGELTKIMQRSDVEVTSLSSIPAPPTLSLSLLCLRYYKLKKIGRGAKKIGLEVSVSLLDDGLVRAFVEGGEREREDKRNVSVLCAPSLKAFSFSRCPHRVKRRRRTLTPTPTTLCSRLTSPSETVR